MSWDDLSMREKAAMMRVAVKNKIFDIDNIKKLYNSYAERENYAADNLGVVLPETTVTPNSKYINNSYYNIRPHLKSNGGPINRFDRGGSTQNKYPTYSELVSNPKLYGLVLDTLDGKLIYRLSGDPEKAKWFYASRAEEVPNKLVDFPVIAPQKQEDNYDSKWYNYNQPATLNYISSQINNMLDPIDPVRLEEYRKLKQKEFISWIPFIGDVVDVYDIGKDFYDGNYTSGLAGLGLMFLPEWAEKGIKKGGRWLLAHASDLYYGLKNKFKKEDNIIWEDILLPTFDLDFRAKQLGVFKNSLLGDKIDLLPNINEWEEAKNIRKFWQGITMPKYKNSQNNIVADVPIYPPGNFYLLKKGDPKMYKDALGHSNGKDAYIYEVDNYGESIPLDEVVVHEGIHNFRDLFDFPLITSYNGVAVDIPWHIDSKYTEKTKQLLDDAYIFDDDFLSKHPKLTPLAEKGATNTLLQYYLAKKDNAFDIESLNRTIDNLSDDDILYYLWQTNSYGKSFTRQLTDEQKIDRALKIREALKGVYKHGGKINRFDT